MRARMIRATTILACVASLTILTCSDSSGPGNTITVDVLLFNVDQFPIHILRPGEGFAPSNRLLEGEEREVRVGHPRDGSGVEFRAGTQGTVSNTVICNSQDPDALRTSGVPAQVMWNGNGLVCMNWDG